MKKRLKDYTVENRKPRANGITQVLPIAFEDNIMPLEESLST